MCGKSRVLYCQRHDIKNNAHKTHFKECPYRLTIKITTVLILIVETGKITNQYTLNFGPI